MKSLTIDQLAEHCEQENGKFSRQQESDPSYCFELLRRALLEDIPQAFSTIYRVYEPIVRRWVYSHSQFNLTDENADYFVSSALSKFYFALRGVKFKQFSYLPQVMNYLKLCAHTAITQYLRDQQRLSTISLDDQEEWKQPAENDPLPNFEEVWGTICKVLPDEEDQLLVDALFIQQMKPTEIAAKYPQRWDSPRAVSVALQRVRRRLRASELLREHAGL